MKLLSKLCSILGAMTLATSAYSASQPLGAGGVEVIRANAGKGTNLNMFSGTIHTAIASNLHIQAPTITGTGTVSMTLYTHDIDITGGSFAGFLPGDDIATLGGAQFTIQKVVSASKVQTRQINVGATFSTASWVRYPAMAYIYDVNGNQVGFISNGGAIGIIGNTGGGNIGEFALLNQFGTNGWDIHLQDTVGDFVIVNNRSVTPNAQGPVLRFSSFATEDAFIIDATSMAIFGFGVSNNGTMWAPNLASNVTAVNHLAQGANGQVVKIPVSSGGSAFPLTANADAARFRITNLQAVVFGPDTAYADTNIWVKAEATNGQNSQLQFLSYAGGDKNLTELAFWQVHLNSTNGWSNITSVASQNGANTGSSITEILTDSMYRYELIQGANNQKKFTMEVDSTPFFAWMTNLFLLTNGNMYVHGDATFTGAGDSTISFDDTNTSRATALVASMGTIRSNLNLYVPTNGSAGATGSVVFIGRVLQGTNIQMSVLGAAATNRVLKIDSDWQLKFLPDDNLGADAVSTIVVSETNLVLLDLAYANVFKLALLTNCNYMFTNATALTRRAKVYFQQDTNGVRLVESYGVAGGILQTNANMQPTTNANALDLLEVEPGFFTTNLIAWWPQNFQPRVAFSGFALSVTQNFNSFSSGQLSGQGSWLANNGQMNVTNSGIAPVSAIVAIYHWNATWAVNHRASVTLTTCTGSATNDSGGVTVRNAGAGVNTCYQLMYYRHVVYLQSYNAGTGATLQSVARIYADGVKLRLSVTGTGSALRLTAQEDTGGGWSALWTDYNPTLELDTGKPGVHGFKLDTGSVRMDDWLGEDL